MDDDAISSFISITQASRGEAKQFLTAFDNNVQAAVEAYFEDPSQLSSAPRRHPIDSDDEDFGGEAQLNAEREPMKQVRRKLISDDSPIARGRGQRHYEPTEAFRDLRAEQRIVLGGTYPSLLSYLHSITKHQHCSNTSALLPDFQVVP